MYVEFGDILCWICLVLLTRLIVTKVTAALEAVVEFLAADGFIENMD